MQDTRTRDCGDILQSSFRPWPDACKYLDLREPRADLREQCLIRDIYSCPKRLLIPAHSQRTKYPEPQFPTFSQACTKPLAFAQFQQARARESKKKHCQGGCEHGFERNADPVPCTKVHAHSAVRALQISEGYGADHEIVASSAAADAQIKQGQIDR